MTVKSKCARNRITRKHSQQKVNCAGEDLKGSGAVAFREGTAALSPLLFLLTSFYNQLVIS